MPDPITIYFAGDLFDHKHLIGNALLAAHIEKHSGERYQCVLPQDSEQGIDRAVEIRNQDLKHVMACDLAIFNFDGTDLDSGTIVEFMFAKFLDIPSVILRTDFRASGDQAEGDDWNLMCSFYPRTKIVQLNAMVEYSNAKTDGSSLEETIDRFYKKIALEIIDALDTVKNEPAIPGKDPPDAERLYQWALKFPGGGFDAFCGPDFVENVISRKRKKEIL